MELTMKNLLFLTLIFGGMISACGGSTATEDTLSLEISADRAFELYQNGTFFLDVRAEEEWDEFHAPNSTWIPLNQLPDRLGELPRDRLIVVVCRSGNRSAIGRDLLLNEGFTQVTSLEGGLKEWVASGYPTATGP
jgi:rhodanese-related sulfurtransferase